MFIVSIKSKVNGTIRTEVTNDPATYALSMWSTVIAVTMNEEAE